MKKLLLVFALILALTCIFAACNEPEDPATPDSGENDDTPTPHTHAFGEWTTVTAATCTVNGEEKRTCACGESEVRAIPATEEHIYGSDNTCTMCSDPLVYTQGLEYYEISPEELADLITDFEELVGEFTSAPYLEGAVAVTGIGTATNVSDLVIPPYHQGKPVLILASDAFRENAEITNVYLPDGLLIFGDHSFSECEMLQDIRIPSSVVYIGDQVLAYTALTTLILPEGVRYLSGSATTYCSELASIRIPSSIMMIEDGGWGHAFEGCPKIICVENGVSYVDNWAVDYDESTSQVVLRDGTVGITTAAFSGSDILESITIPPSVSKIGEHAFRQCDSLCAVYISDIAAWCSIYYRDAVWSNPLCTAENLYLNNVLVTQLDIPEGVTEIGNIAFVNCKSLTQVNLPSTLVTIGAAAFQGCENLESIVIPSGCSTIKAEAFNGCAKITEIVIPSSVICVEPMSFAYCSGLECIRVESGNPVYYSVNNCLIDRQSGILVLGCKSSVIPTEGVTGIGDRAFQGCEGLNSIIIPSNITSIGIWAFSGCSNLTSVTFNASDWSVTQSSDETSGVSVTVGTEEENAILLKSTYSRRYWRKG